MAPLLYRQSVVDQNVVIQTLLIRGGQFWHSLELVFLHILVWGGRWHNATAVVSFRRPWRSSCLTYAFSMEEGSPGALGPSISHLLPSRCLSGSSERPMGRVNGTPWSVWRTTSPTTSLTTSSRSGKLRPSLSTGDIVGNKIKTLSKLLASFRRKQTKIQTDKLLQWLQVQ